MGNFKINQADMKVGLIVACDLNGLIGFDGDLPWHNKTDLKRFKYLTQDCHLIMGRKTYESLPVGKKSGLRLPGRIKHVLTRGEAPENTDDTKYHSNWESALLSLAEDDDVWIIGGAEIYKQALELQIPDFIDVTIHDMIAIPQISAPLDVQANLSSYMTPVPYFYAMMEEDQNPEDPTLWHRMYVRRPGSFSKPYITSLRESQ